MRWSAELPRFALLDGPSPLQPLPRFSRAVGGDAEVWIKRDDLLPLAFGGNKLRNLEFLVGRALADGCDTLITSGRSWSNHCRLTAAAGARAGLAVHLVLTPPPSGDAGASMVLERMLGATIHVAPGDRREDREALVEAVASDLRTAGHRPSVIAVGGTGATGAAGQVLAALEVAGQARAAGAEPDLVVLPSATGGTQAGLLVGFALAGLGARVMGVAVARPADELAPAIRRLVADLRAMTGAPGPRPVELDSGQMGAGYGRPTAAADAAGRLLARTEGILVDPIYTAKALAWVVAAARDGELAGRRVVFWHAGGTPGLFEPLPPA